MSAEWSAYWQKQTLHSCISTFEADTMHLNSIWQSMLDDTVAHCRVLDLATGNGAVLQALSQHCSQGHQLIGVDKARLNPPHALLNNSAITFIDEVDVQDLPFADNHFDVITSQFGIEYSSLPRAIPEALRVLKTNGIFQFVMHCSESAIVETHQGKVAEFDALFQADGLMHTCQDYAERRIQLEQLDQAGEVYLASDITPSKNVSGQFFSAVGKLIELHQGGEPILQHFYAMRQRMENEHKRLQALINAALTKPQRQALNNLLINCGAQIILSELIQGSGSRIMGWRIKGSKKG